jgi:hypothetical protein
MTSVRVIYIIPSDAVPWTGAKGCAMEVLEDLQWFFADEMARLGYGQRTFDIVRELDGSLLFHQINSPLGREQFIQADRRQYPSRCRITAKKHGLCDDSNLTIYFVEAYSIIDGQVRANCSGWSRNGGEAFLSSLYLKMALRDWIADSTPYAGMQFEWIDPGPLPGNLRKWNNHRTTLGDLSGAAYGVIAHELAHGFSVAPQERKGGRYGPLMGSGHRGMRGYFRPDLTDDRCWLRPEDGQVLDDNQRLTIMELKSKSVVFGTATSRSS